MIISRRKYHRDVNEAEERGRVIGRWEGAVSVRDPMQYEREYSRLLDVAAHVLYDHGHTSIATYISNEHEKLKKPAS